MLDITKGETDLSRRVLIYMLQGLSFREYLQLFHHIETPVCSLETILQGQATIENVNHRQKDVLAEKVFRRFGENLEGKAFAVWGLAFKPDTDDMRESPAITVINALAYDPKAAGPARGFWLKGNAKITYCDSKYEALKGADALLLVTEWKEFRSPDFPEIKKLLKTPVIIDGRNQYDRKRMDSYGIEYEQIGVRTAEGASL